LQFSYHQIDELEYKTQNKLIAQIGE